ncbi:GntR family transcriptional regulator [Microvirga massiliensis]|uniref:GntR family transcriptional regulator n=1 Tax=Microvirga massiliensis TaxID=1033741 RepID=UPI0006607514|nr:GntR family transcriptional regulator [Microvirga massiliensis]
MGAPLYQQVRDQLSAALRATAGNPGFELSDANLAKRFGVSRITVRRAVDDLVEAGLLYRVQGRGTFACKPKQAEQLTLTSFLDSWSSQGGKPRVDIAEFSRSTADEDVASRLGIPPASEVSSIKRLRFLDDTLVAVDRRYLRADYGRDLKVQDLKASSLVDYLRNREGVDLDYGEMEIEARLATDADCADLLIGFGQPVLVRQVTLSSQDGVPILTGVSVYRADRIKYRVTVRS